MVDIVAVDLKKESASCKCLLSFLKGNRSLELESALLCSRNGVTQDSQHSRNLKLRSKLGLIRRTKALSESYVFLLQFLSPVLQMVQWKPRGNHCIDPLLGATLLLENWERVPSFY